MPDTSFSPTLHVFHVQSPLDLFFQTFALGMGSAPEQSTSRIVCWAEIRFSWSKCDVALFLMAAYVGMLVLGYSQSTTFLPLIIVTATAICSSLALTLIVKTGGWPIFCTLQCKFSWLQLYSSASPASSFWKSNLAFTHERKGAWTVSSRNLLTSKYTCCFLAALAVISSICVCFNMSGNLTPCDPTTMLMTCTCLWLWILLCVVSCSTLSCLNCSHILHGSKAPSKGPSASWSRQTQYSHLSGWPLIQFENAPNRSARPLAMPLLPCLEIYVDVTWGTKTRKRRDVSGELYNQPSVTWMQTWHVSGDLQSASNTL